MNNKLLNIVCGLLLCLTTQASFAQFGINLNYAYSKPLEQMGAAIQQAQGFSLEFTYQFPKSPFSIGIDLGLSGYGNRKINDFTLMHEGQIEGTYDLKINNYICDAFITGKVDLTSKGFVRPYISARIGIQEYHTDYILENPNISHSVDCPDPIEDGTVLYDVAMAAGVGFGVKIDLGEALHLDLGKNHLYFNVEASYTGGGSVRYMSLNAPANVTPQNTDIPGLAPGITTLNHQYHSGNVYRSAIKMYNVKAGTHVSVIICIDKKIYSIS